MTFGKEKVLSEEKSNSNDVLSYGFDFYAKCIFSLEGFSLLSHEVKSNVACSEQTPRQAERSLVTTAPLLRSHSEN